MPTVPRIGKYELREPLGAAGLTETYRARAPRTAAVRSVAVKLLRLDRLPNEARRSVADRFLDAGRRAAAATVGGMAAVVEVGEDTAGPFVATELLPGIDLAGLVHFARKRSKGAHALDPAFVCALGAQVARILTSAHESSPALPHLGLSPTNVRITPAAGVMVTDFGLAASLRGQADTRLSRCFFLPPELLTADATAALDVAAEAADLYSLGAVLYYLLAGRPPVEGSSTAELLERAWEPPPALPAVPEELDRTIRAMLAPEPKERPASARAVADQLAGGMASPQERRQHIAAALDALGIDWRGKKASKAAAPEISHEPTTAPAGKEEGVGFRYAARRPRRRWRGLSLVLAVLGFALLAGVVLLRPRPRAPTLAGSTKTVGGLAEGTPLNMAEIPPGVVPEMMPSRLDGGLPTDRTYVPAPKRKLPRVPGHLDIDSQPSGADVWIDGVHRGTTPANLDLGDGGHRVVLLKDGFRMHKDVYDTSQGERVRPQLQPMPPLPDSGAYVNVSCRGAGHYPIFVDDEETGRLCPVAQLPVLPGQRKIAVFVPARRAFVATDVYVPPGKKPLPVTVND